MGTLARWAAESALVRSRLAEDTLLLRDILKVAAACARELGKDLSCRGLNLYLMDIIGDGLRAIVTTALQKAKPFIAYFDIAPGAAARLLFFRDIFPFVRGNMNYLEQTRSDLEIGPLCYQFMGVFSPEYLTESYLGGDFVMEGVTYVVQDVVSEQTAHFKKSALGTMPALEDCDHCHALRSKLRRCSSCKVARYCSRRCQVAAWRNGHRERCREEEAEEWEDDDEEDGEE